MSYHTPESKKEEFKRYLERSGAIDSLTSVLVSLYDEPDPRPLESTDYIKKYLSGEGGGGGGGGGVGGNDNNINGKHIEPRSSSAHLASAQHQNQENEKLRKENKDLKQQVKDLNRTIETLRANLKHSREAAKRAREQQQQHNQSSGQS